MVKCAPYTFSASQRKQKPKENRYLLFCSYPLLCPLPHSSWVMCPIQKFRQASSKETWRKAKQRWPLGPRAELEHTHNSLLLNMLSGEKKTCYKTILMALAGVEKELYNVTSPLPMFFLFWESTATLPQLGEGNAWFMSSISAHIRVLRYLFSSSLLGFVSNQLDREMGASMLSLPCFPWWKQGCVMPANPGLGHARTWGWQKGPGLSKVAGGKTQLLRGLLSTPPRVRLLTATVHISSFCTHLAHLFGTRMRKEYYAVPERGQRPIIQPLPG